MEDAQSRLDGIEVEGVAGGGLVRIKASAKGRVIGVAIDDSLLVPSKSGAFWKIPSWRRSIHARGRRRPMVPHPRNAESADGLRDPGRFRCRSDRLRVLRHSDALGVWSKCRNLYGF
jgi:hypothetical protein